MFQVLNSAVNPFVYFILLKDIRKTLIAVCRPKVLAHNDRYLWYVNRFANTLSFLLP